MYTIATDLDRTLLPNGNQPYDGSMHLFNEILKKERFKLIYVTGRSLELVKDAIIEYHAPYPDFIIGEVGTKIYSRKGDRFVEDKGWLKNVKGLTRCWSIYAFKKELSVLKGLRLQEEDKQNVFKLSYYVDELKNAEIVVKGATRIIESICPDAAIIYSVDETNNIGFLDILPKHATKLTALEYLTKKEGLAKDKVICCGDSGNDILFLSVGYKSILVRNATRDVRNVVKGLCFQENCEEMLYIAEGYGKLNGYYVSGIIEGLIKFEVISKEYGE